jgi:hypothetical protein
MCKSVETVYVFRGLVIFGDWSFGEWSPSGIGRSEIGRSENGRSENDRSENGRCTILYYLIREANVQQYHLKS